MRHLVSVLLGLALALSCGACLAPAPIEGAMCNKDRRCPTHYFCQGAKCHGGDPFVASLLCDTDDECDGDAYCHPTDGLCVQCYAPQHCLTGLCTDTGTCATCQQDADCAETGQCNTYGYCAACTSDAHCPGEDVCLPGLGQCVEEDRRESGQSGREGRPMESS